MIDTTNVFHMSMLGLIVVAAIVFAWFGKMDVAVAFGISGSAVGLAWPTATKGPPAPPTTPTP